MLLFYNESNKNLNGNYASRANTMANTMRVAAVTEPKAYKSWERTSLNIENRIKYSKKI